MPPLPDVPNVCRVKLGWTDATDNSVSTTLHFRYSGGPPSNADALALATDLMPIFTVNMRPLLDTESMCDYVEVTDLSSPSGGSGVFSGPLVGTHAGSVLAGGTAVLVSHEIARRYRGGKPRSYPPLGVSADLTNRQNFSPAFVADVQAGWDTMISAMSAVSAGSTLFTGPVSVSYYSGFTPFENPITHRWRNVSDVRAVPVVDTIVSSIVRAAPSSQRRRN